MIKSAEIDSMTAQITASMAEPNNSKATKHRLRMAAMSLARLSAHVQIDETRRELAKAEAPLFEGK